MPGKERGAATLTFCLSRENTPLQTAAALEYQPTSWAPAVPTFCLNFLQGGSLKGPFTAQTFM